MAILTIFSGLLGLFAVAFGAFGAHGLEGQLDDRAMALWSTATSYALPHAAAILAISLCARTSLVQLGGWALALGSVLFAGSLYGLALGAPSAVGAITPVGGLLLLLGWGLIAAGGTKEAKARITP